MSVAIESEPLAGASDLVAISASMIVPSRLDGISIYACEPGDRQVRLFHAPNVPITAEWIRRLKEGRHRKLYVRTQDYQTFLSGLQENLKEFVDDESVSVTQRFELVNEVVRDVLGNSLASPDLDTTIAKVENLAQQVVELVCRSNVVSSELCGMMSHDYHTFTHVANVSYYCVMLAQECGIKSRGELNQVAVGAMLHDLGKNEIPDAILRKPTKLTDEEFRIIKKHPTTGFVQLCKRTDLTFAQLMMVYQHHEHLDGSGYPVGVSGSEIHPWARICTVADVYEALTSNRPYRVGLTADAAFRIMDKKASTAYDVEVYERWKALMLKR